MGGVRCAAAGACGPARGGKRAHTLTGIGPRESVESIMVSQRAAISCALLALFVLGERRLSAQSPTDLAGSWTLNRELSQFPREVGFSASFLPTEPTGGADRQGRRGGIQSETQEDAT